jgi:hypothetical protein
VQKLARELQKEIQLLEEERASTMEAKDLELAKLIYEKVCGIKLLDHPM